MRVFFAAVAGLALLSLPAAPATIPRPAPELSFKLADGKPAKLSQWRGKVIVLEFLLTTCSHCQQTSQTMKRIQAEYARSGVQAVGVAINDENGTLTSGYVKDFGLTFPVGWVKRELAIDFLQHPIMVSMMMPQLVFIDRTGVIRAQYSGTDPFFQNEESGMRKTIESLLKESRGKRAPSSWKAVPQQSK